MTDSDVQRVADEVVNRIAPILAGERNGCEMMHRGLVDEFKLVVTADRAEFMKIIDDDRTSFRTSLAETRDTVFEKATGKKWDDREQVRDGIAFAIAARLLTKKALVVTMGVMVLAVCAWLGLR